MNKTPCGKCANYDPILGPGEKHKGLGWCIPRSKYPAQEGPGQVFPPGVKRVEHGKLAEPYIVEEHQVIEQCTFVRQVDYNQAEAKREAQTTKDASGNRVLS